MRLEKRVLVLGAGGNVSQGIIKALRKTNLPIHILGACVSEYSKGLYMCDEGYICPYASEMEFIPWVIDFCNMHDIDIIMTGVEENIIELAKNKDVLKACTKAVFVSSSYNQLLVGQDKFLTCRFLQDKGCNYPPYELWTSMNATKDFADRVGYPIIAKPRNGKGSKGVFVFRSARDVEKQTFYENYVLEKVIGNEETEYTIGCYVDRDGNLQQLIPMRRKLLHGTTMWAETVQNEKIIDECTKICNAFKPTGPLNIQLRLDSNGTPICFELNVRFSGTTAIRSHFGFQDVKAMILEYCYEEGISECFQITQGEVFRYDEELYLESDTIELMKTNKMIENIQRYLLFKEV